MTDLFKISKALTIATNALHDACCCSPGNKGTKFQCTYCDAIETINEVLNDD